MGNWGSKWPTDDPTVAKCPKWLGFSQLFLKSGGNIKNGKHFGATNSRSVPFRPSSTSQHSAVLCHVFLLFYTHFFGSFLGLKSWQQGVELSCVEARLEVEVECSGKRKQGGAISKFTAWNYETLNKSMLGRRKRSKGVFLQYIKTQDFTSASKLIKRLAYLKSFAPARRWHRHRHRHHHFHSHHHYGHWLVPDPAAPSSASRLQFNHVSAGKLLAKIRARQILRIRLVSALKGCCWSYSCCGRCCCCCQVLC